MFHQIMNIKKSFFFFLYFEITLFKRFINNDNFAILARLRRFYNPIVKVYLYFSSNEAKTPSEV